MSDSGANCGAMHVGAGNVRAIHELPLREALPEGWVIRSLDNVSKVIMGQSPPSSTYNTDGNGIPFFQGKGEFGSLYPNVRKWCSKPSKIAQKNDVLISVRAPVGPTNLAPSECCIGRGLAAIHPPEGIPAKYILFYLRSIESEIEALGTGTTFKAISGPILRSLSVPVAPPTEQTLIVSEIEKQFSRLDEAVAALKRIKANLKRYKASVLKAAVEGKLTEEWRKEHPDVEPAKELLKRILVERRRKWEEAFPKKKYKVPTCPDTKLLPFLPTGWSWVSTDQLFWFITSGSRGWAKYYVDKGAVFLRIGNLDHDSIILDLADIQHVQPPLGTEGTRTRVKNNDILISITADVGMIAVIPEKFGEAYINQHVSLARPVEAVYSSYIAWFLASRLGQQQFRNLQRGATKAGLGLDDIRLVTVPFPPIDEQIEIISQLEKRLSIIEEMTGEVNKNLKRADRLRQSILKKAFSGKLVLQAAGTK